VYSVRSNSRIVRPPQWQSTETRERVRERECVCVCVFVCVYERFIEGKRVREVKKNTTRRRRDFSGVAG